MEYLDRAAGKRGTQHKASLERLPWQSIAASLSVCAIVVAVLLILLSFYVFAVLSDKQLSKRNMELVAGTPKVEVVDSESSDDVLSMNYTP